MVQFVGVEDMARLVGAVGVTPFLRGLAGYIEADFLRWEAFDKVARVASHSRAGVIELMPTSDDALYSFKYVNGHPGNTQTGLQTVTALGLLADVRTGYPVLLSEMTLLTALRTAATSALAARALARPGSRTMAMIGLGAQSEFQAFAFAALLGITDLRVHDVDPAATAKFIRNVAPHGFDIHVSDGAAQAARGADIVTTATADKCNATILTDAMVAPGQHLNAVGGDCPGKTELDPAILRRADVFVEFAPQTRIEGEIQRMPADFPVTELWRVIAGTAAGRRSAEAVTVFDSVGFATEDFSALRFVRDRVAATGFCREIDLMADLPDPRDLFSLVAPVRLASAA